MFPERPAEALATVALLVGASSHKLQGHGFDSGHGAYLGCRFGPLSGCVWLFLSHISVSHPLLSFPTLSKQ